MSSSMLEQAVIDAEALKEAAIKNAEQEVLEKYSTDIKEAVETLLEQEEDEFGLGGEEDTEEREDVVDQVTMGATEGERLCPCAEEAEQVTLDLDQLVAMAGSEEEGEELEMDMGEPTEEVPPEEEELFEVNDENLMEVISQVLSEKKADKDYDNDGKTESAEEEWKGSRKAAIEKSEEEEKEEEKEKKNEDLDIDEEQLSDILEALTVDIENVPHGMNFHNHPTKSEDEQSLNVALAKEQDTAFAEEQKELRKAIKKLQEQVKSQMLQLNKQKKEYKQLKSIAIKATKKLEEVNFSNAKLIYTNRILESDSLNERQKTKLVEAISKVGSVEEAKIVFNTLKENLSSKSSNVPKTLNEAVSKNNPLVLKSNNETQPAKNPQVSRLKRLAGII